MNRGQKGAEIVIRGGKEREGERERERKVVVRILKEPLRSVTVESTI